MEEANAEIDRLSEAVKELAVKLMLLEKRGCVLIPLAPVPAPVVAATKTVLLEAIEYALPEGWPLVKACAVLGLEGRQARRWTRRKDTGTPLAHARPGASLNA